MFKKYKDYKTKHFIVCFFFNIPSVAFAIFMFLINTPYKNIIEFLSGVCASIVVSLMIFVPINAIIKLIKLLIKLAKIESEPFNKKYQQPTNMNYRNIKLSSNAQSEMNSKLKIFNWYDILFVDAARFAIEKDKCSTSMLQRRFKIGLNRANRIIDQLEYAGIVDSDKGKMFRNILISSGEFELYLQNLPLQCLPSEENNQPVINTNKEDEKVKITKPIFIFSWYDALFEDAARFAIEKNKCSVIMLQDMFKIDHYRAIRIISQLEEAGIVDIGKGKMFRNTLISSEEFERSLRHFANSEKSKPTPKNINIDNYAKMCNKYVEKRDKLELEEERKIIEYENSLKSKEFYEIDTLFKDAALLAIEKQKIDTTILQNAFNITFSHANKLIEQLQYTGVINNDVQSTKILINTQKAEILFKYCHNTSKPENSEHRDNDESSFSFVDIKYDYLTGEQFEGFCMLVLKRNNYINVKSTKATGDQGVDILAEKDGIKFAIQCKCYSKPIGNNAVQQVLAGKDFYNCHIGVVMTNQFFTNAAIELAKKTNILLWDRNKLNSLIKNFNV